MKLRQAVALAAHVASRTAALPIMQHVRIDGAHVTACSVDQQLEIPMALPGGLTKAAFCVHASHLTRILKGLPEEIELDLKHVGARLFLTAGPTRYELNALGPEDFPRLDMPPEGAFGVTLESKAFVDAVRFCLPAMATNDIRYYLNGLHLDIAPGRMALTATDGNCLHRARVAFGGDSDGERRTAIIPGAGVARILDIVGGHQTFELTLATTLAIVNADGETLSAKLIDGQFPDAGRVIPSDRAATGSVGRLALAAAVKRVAQIFDGEKFQCVTLGIKRDAIELSALNADAETASERFDWSAADGRFKQLAIGFQWRYLVDALEAFPGERVNLHLPDKEGDTLYLTDADDGHCEAVIMPARI